MLCGRGFVFSQRTTLTRGIKFPTRGERGEKEGGNRKGKGEKEEEEKREEERKGEKFKYPCQSAE